MKAIILHTAALDNGGERHDAGAQLTIGEDPGENSLAQAQALVAAHSAVAVAPLPSAAALVAPETSQKPARQAG